MEVCQLISQKRVSERIMGLVVGEASASNCVDEQIVDISVPHIMELIMQERFSEHTVEQNFDVQVPKKHVNIPQIKYTDKGGRNARGDAEAGSNVFFFFLKKKKAKAGVELLTRG